MGLGFGVGVSVQLKESFIFRISDIIFCGPAEGGIPMSGAKRKAENRVALRKIGPAAVERKGRDRMMAITDKKGRIKNKVD